MYYSPVRHSSPSDAFDLHVLGTPPAFILSQDQTLHCLLFLPDNLLVCLALFCLNKLFLIDVVFYSFSFSFQCPLTRLSRRVPIYITIPFYFCKAFFGYFFKKFYILFVLNIFMPYIHCFFDICINNFDIFHTILIHNLCGG